MNLSAKSFEMELMSHAFTIASAFFQSLDPLASVERGMGIEMVRIGDFKIAAWALGNSVRFDFSKSNMSLRVGCVLDCEAVGISDSCTAHNCKKRRVSSYFVSPSSETMRAIESPLPILHSSDYYIKPSFKELVTLELLDPGYCSRVPDFIVGRFGYGSVRYLEETDVRGLNLDEIVKFHKHEIIVYGNENDKPAIGQALNKAAEVVLIVDSRSLKSKEWKENDLVCALKQSTGRQGAKFISFDAANGEWKFLVEHFSRFGFSEDDEEDIVMDDAAAIQDPVQMDDAEIYDVDKETPTNFNEVELCHSLPKHLRLDPVKVREMRLLMFPHEDDPEESSQKSSLGKVLVRPSHNSAQAMSHKSSPPFARKTPLALHEYRHGSFESNSPGAILMAQQHKGMPLRTVKTGFKLDIKHETPVSGNYARNIVDAGLFMGRSFRVGWGPNGILVHTGALVGSDRDKKVLSSVVNLEKVAFDKMVRDENNKVSEELVDFAFDTPLNFHKGINRVMKEVEVGTCKLRFQKLEVNRTMLSEITHGYCDIIERQLAVPGLSSSARLVLTHQVMSWELIKVLFSDRQQKGQIESLGADNEEDMMQDMKELCRDVDQEAFPLIRRAEFSYWLQESVSYHVQNQLSSLNEYDYLQHIFVLLTGRQLDAAVQLAVSKGDVRLAILLSQAGGSTVNRSDVARQLDLWRINRLDFSFIEKSRLRLYELLAGNIHGALLDVKLDWRRFLGLLMWYQLPPDSSLSIVFQTYKHLLDQGRAPYPLPLFIDELPSDEVVNWNSDNHFDLSFYLMLLHAGQERDFSFLKAMFSAFSSTPDPLDYHMIWHQRALLEAVGVISSNDLYILDMGLVSQLLCAGKCHWAVYVALHMAHCENYPYLLVNLIREILFQYCETWSSNPSQRQFIENLGVPTEWLHEAMAIYYNYHGDHSKSLENFLECANWQKAHTVFITSVAYKLFLSAKHTEIWSIATSMEGHKSEIENWEFGAGVYISFYLIRNSLQEDNSMTEMDSLQNKNSGCQDFISQLNESLAVWGSRLPIDARYNYMFCSSYSDIMC
ncbi:nuclear pore complex protein NUP96 [Senna tora]|uniref:Nuclear pore complex protein NUP96 n=1 Tax=Senna tora TaxID=362788 RepID=A0A834XBY6_9FABA|nr:nuclear pore complex protein NUP96 [Senna tora]